MTSEANESTSPEERLLRIENLRTYFPTKAGIVRAVDDVTLSVGQGEALGIVGESGSGKTVLLRSIFGLLPRVGVVRGGRTFFRGVDLTSMSEKQRRAFWGTGMAMIFQDPMTSLNPVKKIGLQIMEGLRYHKGVSTGIARQTTLHLLEEVGLPDPLTRIGEYPHQLSGGMRQRVMIAIALACDPALLCADEPTTALDVTIQAQILDLLDQLRRDRGMALILVTHDLGVVAGRTDRIAVMYSGKIVETASTSDLFARSRMPYTQALIASIPPLRSRSHTRLATIPGRPPDPVRFPAGCRFHPRCSYAKGRCAGEDPPLVEDREASSHLYACWFPLTPDQSEIQPSGYA